MRATASQMAAATAEAPDALVPGDPLAPPTSEQFDPGMSLSAMTHPLTVPSLDLREIYPKGVVILDVDVERAIRKAKQALDLMAKMYAQNPHPKFKEMIARKTQGLVKWGESVNALASEEEFSRTWSVDPSLFWIGHL